MAASQFCVFLLLSSIVYIFGQPSLININSQGLRPEGIEWTPSTNFLISSLTYGTINSVSDTGALTKFVNDSRLQSTLGLQYISTNYQLLIVNANSTAAFNNKSCRNQNRTRCVESSLIVANMFNGQVLREIDFTPIAANGRIPLANDVATDNAGNAWVTDSFQNYIYQVNYLTGKILKVIQSAAFTQGYVTGSFGLNGIEYQARTGLLVVCRTDNGKLYRVNITGSEVREVSIPKPLYGADGLKFTDSGDLVVVTGNGTVYLMSSSDNWNSATQKDSAPTLTSATTAALRQGSIYVVHSHIDQPLTASVFEIEKITFGTLLPTPSPRPSTLPNNIPLLNNKLLGDWQTDCHDNSTYTMHFGGKSWNLKVNFYSDKNCNDILGTYFVAGTFSAYDVIQPWALNASANSSSSNVATQSASQTRSFSRSMSPSVSSSQSPSSSKGQTATPSPSAYFSYIANDPSLFVYIPGAYPADFIITTRTLTPYTNQSASVYNASGCGIGPFSVGQATTLKAGACPALGLVNESAVACPLGERDVIYFNSTTLLLGNRTNHVMCNLPRPTSLSPYAFNCISDACRHHNKGSDRFSPDGTDIAIFVIVIAALLLCLCCLCIILIVLLIKG